MALVKAAQQTSSSNAPRYCRYHVFLSFRGEETRKTFTDHLYTALVNAGFHTFRDDDELERGEDIKPELQKAIKQSRTSVIVFSKDYASSRWCLDELVMILERRRTSDDHFVLPVFYDMDPSHARKQTGSLAKAFASHQKTQTLKKLKAWREALAEVADLAGMVLQNQAHGYEAKFIKKIVKVIGDKLNRTPLSVAPNMIGRHSQVAEIINLWLQHGSTNVGILVIYGISGIGKTTIAKLVYNSNFQRFEGSSFLENIKEISRQPNGLVHIQTQLLSDILNGKKVNIHSVSQGITQIEEVISSKRVLLVLDDVDHVDQLDAVLRMKDRFFPGSKIIITTRRARLLKADQVTQLHAVETLDHRESLKLFSWHAFGQDHPLEDYIEYSEKLVDHCGGLPLALKVLGSSLLRESIDVWKSALDKLEAIPNSEIINKLRVSYDSLQDDHDRNLFLHIACFFIGREKDYIVKILDGCGFYTIVGIQNLIDRCLLTIDKCENVQVHDLICRMGREIVRLESEEPWNRSRVLHHKDSFKILAEKKGTRTIEGLVLDMHINSNEKVLETNAFERMPELKLLHLSHVQLDGCYAEFCRGLRWLCWLKFSLDSIPFDFPLGSLIVLEMQYSGLRQICEGTKRLPLLKILDLSHSHSLTNTPDFSCCPNLEKLVLVDCESLVGINESIGNLERLVDLSLRDCKNLRMLPKNILMLKSLETLIVSGCTNLSQLSIEMLRNMESLKVLETDGIPLGEFWSGRSSSILSCLPCSIVDLSLEGCNISDDVFPRDFSNLSSLRRLNLAENPICSLPNCIRGLTGLIELSFSRCAKLESLVGLPKVSHLDLGCCVSLKKIAYQSFEFQHHITSGYDNHNLVEWEYNYKLEPIGRVDADMINLLGLCNLESMEPIRIRKPYNSQIVADWSPVQGLYERGIFSTYFAGNEVPGQFSHKSRGPSISFTVPLLDNHRIGGLKVFSVYTKRANDSPWALPGPMITRVTNKSKNIKWIYAPSHCGIPGKGEDMIWLSHWTFEEKVHIDVGDKVVVSVTMQPWLQVKEFGFQLVQQLQSTLHQTIGPYKPGVHLLSRTNVPIHDLIWFNKIRGDSDEEDMTVELERVVHSPTEQKEVEHVLSLPSTERATDMLLACESLVSSAVMRPNRSDPAMQARLLKLVKKGQPSNGSANDSKSGWADASPHMSVVRSQVTNAAIASTQGGPKRLADEQLPQDPGKRRLEEQLRRDSGKRQVESFESEAKNRRSVEPFTSPLEPWVDGDLVLSSYQEASRRTLKPEIIKGLFPEQMGYCDMTLSALEDQMKATLKLFVAAQNVAAQREFDRGKKDEHAVTTVELNRTIREKAQVEKELEFVRGRLESERKKNVDLSYTLEVLNDEKHGLSQELFTVKKELDETKRRIESLSSQLQSTYDDAVKDFVESAEYQNKLNGQRMEGYFDLIEKVGEKYPFLDWSFLDDDAEETQADEGEGPQ